MKSKGIVQLTSKQMHALPYIAICPSYEEAARQSRVSVKQIHYWLKMPLFQEELNRQRKLVFMDTVKALKLATRQAVSTLVACLEDVNAKNRISAADKILHHALHSSELFEMHERLDQVEARVDMALNQPQILKTIS